jgi:hypothetical protein
MRLPCERAQQAKREHLLSQAKLFSARAPFAIS